MALKNPSEKKHCNQHGLWVCDVLHERRTPKKHRFKNKLFWYGLNVSQLDTLPQWLGFFSKRLLSLVQFQDSDFFPTQHDGLLPSRLTTYLKVSENITIPEGSDVILLGQLRTFGYIFNPISLYVIVSPEQEPLCVVAEVTNTFYERKAFLLRRKTWESKSRTAKFTGAMPKHFYVSPFSDLTLHFNFSFLWEPDHFSLIVNSVDDNQNIHVHTKMTGSIESFSFLTFIKLFLQCPFMPQKMISMIHLQAFILWLKKIPFHQKNENLQWQNQLLFPSNT